MNDYIYSFRTPNNIVYYVNCVQYDIGVYAVKFCLKKDRKSPNKYKVITKNGWAKAILKTVVSVMLDILERDEFASYAFIGMPRIGEPCENTTRYSVYRKFCERYFNPASFDHFYDDDKSFYAMLNRKSNVDKQHRELIKIASQELKDEGIPTSNPVSFTRSTHGQDRRKRKKATQTQS